MRASVRPDLTAQELRNTLRYDSTTGEFKWREWKAGRRANLDSVAGSIAATGYRTIAINRISYLAHRLAWLYINGRWPDQCIDHIDGNRSNNAISNLRQADYANNAWNVQRQGWSIDKRYKNKKYRSCISVRGRRISLGYFATEVEARDAYLAGTKKYFRKFSAAHRESCS